ncbi:SdrD B-like domain-containing protein [Staphylococcus lutrae]|uniref:YSIRK-type signal peptide-containing protein n=1 Tax=Staphylococcus lutrae TaxID=155085 RepID=A0AAC9RPT7_9STAP|nr:SdrD B-like domain-containing protein [Staphylococcus lutrae]ARJ51818.1 hypothetical protein B5P37_11070 [Staphylococcus lutrae]PNZ36059.1 hypothetical protein CD134_08350 [Staphylococcus lutrae]
MKKNRQIYSIRKHKLGVASLLLGATFILGEAKEAHASDASNTENQSQNDTETTGHSLTNINATEQTTTDGQAIVPFNKLSQTHIDNETSLTQQPIEVRAEDTSQKAIDLTPQNNVIDHTVTTQNTESRLQAPINKNIVNRTNNYHTVATNIEKGQNVTSKVKVTNSSIENPNEKQTVNPHQAQRITLKYEWKFEDEIKPHDYFEFTLSQNVDTYGVSTIKKVPQILDSSNQVIAYGEVLDQNRIRYYFTDYMATKKDVTANLSLNLFINPIHVQKQGNITVQSTLGSHVTQNDHVNVIYLNGVKNVKNTTLIGRIDSLSKAEQTFTHFAYFKPSSTPLTSVTLTGMMKNGQNNDTSKIGEVELYEYLGTEPLAESVYADVNNTSLFKKVTPVTQTTTNNGKSVSVNSNGYTMNIDSFNGKEYVIRYKGFYNGDTDQLTFTTNATGYYKYNNDSQYYYSATSPQSFNLTWDNGVVFYSNKANGEGKDLPATPIIEFSPVIDTVQDTVAPAVTYQATGTIEEQYDSHLIILNSASGNDYGHGHYDEIETIEDTMAYTTENNLLEFDETLELDVRGEQIGVLEEITDTHTVDTISQLGTERGSLEGTQTTIEEDTLDITPPTHHSRSPLVIDLNTSQKNPHGSHMGIQSTEEDSPRYTIGDFVWIDGDHNGVQNDGEVGLTDVHISLVDEKGTVIATTTSDSNGHYAFHHVAPGKYQVIFTTPEGYEPTSKHTTARTDKDSDGRIANITVTQDDMTIDAGFFPLKNWGGEEPEMPEQPQMPEKPGMPEQPQIPEKPEVPEQPQMPEKPEVPEQPQMPEKPEMPEQPQMPEKPETPEQPQTPEKPEVPEQPQIPEKPETPEQPQMPEKPETPEQPQIPENKKADDENKHDVLPGTGEHISTPYVALLSLLLGVGLFVRRKKARK